MFITRKMEVLRMKKSKTKFFKIFAHYRNDTSPCEYCTAAKSSKEAREKFISRTPWLKVFAVVEISEEEYWESKGIKENG